MKIAVTYENGQIFQHFGKTETFKIYDVNDQGIVSSEVIASGDTGHSALAGFLAEQSVQVLICGGLGEGAQSALAEAGIEIFSGAKGDPDQAVDAYLNGTLVSLGANCDHHHEEYAEEEASLQRTVWKLRWRMWRPGSDHRSKCRKNLPDSLSGNLQRWHTV